jgi:hypothetical protein
MYNAIWKKEGLSEESRVPVKTLSSGPSYIIEYTMCMYFLIWEDKVYYEEQKSLLIRHQISNMV